MSIVQIDSNFTLINKTDHFLTLQISSKENSSFRLSSSSENVHPVNFSDVYLEHNSFFNYYMETAWSALNGQRLYAVAVNRGGVRCSVGGDNVSGDGSCIRRVVKHSGSRW